MELSTVADIILDAGLIGVLIVGLWAFFKGHIWPKEMVEKTLEAQQKAADSTAEILGTKITAELSNGIRKAMVEGIAEGYLKINGGNS